MSDDLTGLNLVELYDLLVLPDEPEAVSMWPQTVGWLWLGVLLLSLAAVLTWKLLAWRRATAYRRAALVELKLAGDDPAAIANVLRRAALCAFPREDVSGLFGPDWLKFLDTFAPDVRFVGSEAGQVLAKAAYTTQKPHPELSGMAQSWVRRHRQPRGRG